MKLTVKYILIVFFIAFYGCSPKRASGVLFDEPQPSEKHNISKFPRWIIGDYQSINGNGKITVNQSQIIRITNTNYDTKIHTNELDSTNLIIGDSIFIDKVKFHFKRIGDSLLINMKNTFIDTLFDLKANNLLRALKGDLFINKQFGDDEWDVQKVKLQRKLLTISYIPYDKINLLENITGVKKDTIDVYKIKPTRKQFETIVQKGGFCEVDSFIR